MPLIRNWCLGLTGQESVHVSWTDFDSLGRCVVKHNGVAFNGWRIGSTWPLAKPCWTIGCQLFGHPTSDELHRCSMIFLLVAGRQSPVASRASKIRVGTKRTQEH